MATSLSEELLQVHAELWNHTFSYLKSMALECAIKLGIPTAIHCRGGAASLPDLLASLPVPESKKSYLPRLMRFLAVSDAGADGCTNFSPFVLFPTNKYLVTAAMHLSEWFKSDEGSAAVETPLKMAHGMDLWTIMSRDPTINQVFNAGMASDTQFTMNFVVSNCSEVFDGVTSLVDVGGGNGTSARSIAKAFPHIKCSVLDLPIVINSIPADGVVEYIAGDMMSSIPMADAVLLKHVLHDWNDEDCVDFFFFLRERENCVEILTECRKAIPKSGGKVIIMDVVIGSPYEANYKGQVMSDLLMMVITSGKERDEHEWRKMFVDAGFSHNKTKPILGCLSIIELYP